MTEVVVLNVVELNLWEKQWMDKHVADIMTYDDLLFRLRNIIESLKIKINTKVEWQTKKNLNLYNIIMLMRGH